MKQTPPIQDKPTPSWVEALPGLFVLDLCPSFAGAGDADGTGAACGSRDGGGAVPLGNTGTTTGEGA